MVSIFKTNEPAENSAVQSAVIRENFEAIYDKVRPLEVQAKETPSSIVTVQGGGVYFRSSSQKSLQFMNFQTTELDIATTTGWKTLKNQGTLSREKQAFVGPSDYIADGLFLEILIALGPDGKLTFTEAVSGQNNEASSPFNIYQDDSEIPIAFIILEKASDGALQPITQLRINDARPVITTAYQNNPEVADLEDITTDNATRLNEVERSLAITENGLCRQVSVDKLQADLTETTNTKIEILSAQNVLDGYGRLLNFAGGYIDFGVDIASPYVENTRTYDGGVTSGMLAGENNKYIKSIIYLEWTTPSSGENCLPVIAHGSPNADYTSATAPALTNGGVPIASIIYRINSTADDIEPILTNDFLGNQRINYTYPITEISYFQDTNAFLTMTVDESGVVEPFPITSLVDIYDDNTRPIRAKIDSVGGSGSAIEITLIDTIVGISANRNPKIRFVEDHIDLIEDLRPMLGSIGAPLA